MASSKLNVGPETIPDGILESSASLSSGKVGEESEQVGAELKFPVPLLSKDRGAQRGLTILIEGMDLSGKSTLVKGIKARMNAASVKFKEGHNSTSNSNMVAKAADNLRKEDGVSRQATGALFLASHLLDDKLFEYPSPGCVHIQDSSFLRTFAFHQVDDTEVGGYRISELLEQSIGEQRCFPEFDLVLFLTASLEVRRERLKKRKLEAPDQCDEDDENINKKVEFFQQNEERLLSWANRYFPHALVHVDTDILSVDKMREWVWQKIVEKFDAYDISWEAETEFSDCG